MPARAYPQVELITLNGTIYAVKGVTPDQADDLQTDAVDAIGTAYLITATRARKLVVAGSDA